MGSGGTASLFGGSSQSAPGSSNSSAVVSIPNHADPSIATVNDLLDIGESWTGGSVSHNSRGLDSVCLLRIIKFEFLSNETIKREICCLQLCQDLFTFLAH